MTALRPYLQISAEAALVTMGSQLPFAALGMKVRLGKIVPICVKTD